MITIKSFEEIYASFKDKFYTRTKLDIARGTVIDMLMTCVSSIVSEVYQYIEANKKPYLFTKQSGDELDSTGFFLQCPRLDDETDENYFYRLSHWTTRSASCNTSAIEEAIKTLEYSSSANYVPYTQGIGTGTIYLIPVQYNDEVKTMALEEAKKVIDKVISASSVIDYKVPTPAMIKLVAYLDVKTNSDLNFVKRQIETQVMKYINNIAPGDRLMLGEINNMGLDTSNVEYFNVVQLYINDEEATSFEILQTIEHKFLFDQIVWWEVTS